MSRFSVLCFKCSLHVIYRRPIRSVCFCDASAALFVIGRSPTGGRGLAPPPPSPSLIGRLAAFLHWRSLRCGQYNCSGSVWWWSPDSGAFESAFNTAVLGHGTDRAGGR
ncbi:hypothetical protein AOLI_G00054790 [Acnodon oligacanthus]